MLYDTIFIIDVQAVRLRVTNDLLECILIAIGSKLIKKKIIGKQIPVRWSVLLALFLNCIL